MTALEIIGMILLLFLLLSLLRVGVIVDFGGELRVRLRVGPVKLTVLPRKEKKAQKKAAEAAGADYLGSGAVFGTSTKKDAKPMDHALLQEICESVKIPVVAIGGIDGGNILTADADKKHRRTK